MILVLGGTTEGRGLAKYLREADFEVLLSAATAFAPDRGWSGISVRTGPLDPEEFASLISDKGIRAVVDATHPFAQEISRTARLACNHNGLPYLRYERPAAIVPDDPSILRVDLIDMAAEKARLEGNRVFLATGVRSIERFVKKAPTKDFFARVLPWPDSLNEALKWLPPGRVIAGLGPFTREFNMACFRLFNCDVLVTKNSGAGSGTEAKLSAALELEMKVILIDRPKATPEAARDYKAMTLNLRKALNGRA